MIISRTHIRTDDKDPPVPIPRGRGNGGSSYHRSAVTRVMRFHDKPFIFSNPWKTYPHSMKKLFFTHRMGISFQAVGEIHWRVYNLPDVHILCWSSPPHVLYCRTYHSTIQWTSGRI